MTIFVTCSQLWQSHINTHTESNEKYGLSTIRKLPETTHLVPLSNHLTTLGCFSWRKRSRCVGVMKCVVNWWFFPMEICRYHPSPPVSRHSWTFTGFGRSFPFHYKRSLSPDSDLQPTDRRTVTFNPKIAGQWPSTHRSPDSDLHSLLIAGQWLSNHWSLYCDLQLADCRTVTFNLLMGGRWPSVFTDRRTVTLNLLIARQ